MHERQDAVSAKTMKVPGMDDKQVRDKVAKYKKIQESVTETEANAWTVFSINSVFLGAVLFLGFYFLRSTLPLLAYVNVFPFVLLTGAGT